jgi:hypothetical protein
VKAKRHLADLGEGISVGARQRNLALAGKTLDEVPREYLETRGITHTVVQRNDGKRVEQPHLSPAAKLKALTARDSVKDMTQKFDDWRHKPITSITRDMVEQRHRTLSERSPAEANRAMRYLRALFCVRVRLSRQHRSSRYPRQSGPPSVSEATLEPNRASNPLHRATPTRRLVGSSP